MNDYKLTFPDDFASYEHEVEDKGWYSAAILMHEDKKYLLNFFDPNRLAQEIDAECQRNGLFFEENLVVIPVITKDEMNKAVHKIMKFQEQVKFVPLT